MRFSFSFLLLLGSIALFCSGSRHAESAEPASDFLWELNSRGFASFEHKGHSFVPHPSDGVLDIFNRTPTFDGEEFEEGPAPEVSASGDKVTLTYAWGTVEATYTGTDAGVNIAVKVTNSSAKYMDKIAIQFVRLTYSAVAKISVDDSEPKPFDGGVWPIFDLAESGRHATVIYPEGKLEVSAESKGEVEGVAGFFFAESEGLTNRISIVFSNIPSGQSRQTTLKLKFK